MALLEGTNIAPKTAAETKKLIGKHVRYLRGADIINRAEGTFFQGQE
jgi:hypothetical protein